MILMPERGSPKFGAKKEAIKGGRNWQSKLWCQKEAVEFGAQREAIKKRGAEIGNRKGPKRQSKKKKK